MIISSYQQQFSPDFSVTYDGVNVTVSFWYGLYGIYDDEAGYYNFSGEAYVTLGTYTEYDYKSGSGGEDAPFYFDFALHPNAGVPQTLEYSLTDWFDGTVLNFTSTLYVATDADNYLGGSGVDIIFGSVLNDTLGGGAGNDLIEGGDGTDTLDGGTGADRLDGGLGNDVYRLDTQADLVIEAVGNGYDRAYSSVTYALRAGVSVELLGTTNRLGASSINLIGNELAQRLEGNAGANILNGGDGADLLAGYGGNDTYYVTSVDRVFESAGEGTLDRVLSANSFTLEVGADVEYLATTNQASTTGLNLVGNGVAQTIIGNAGANILVGHGGADLLRGLGGVDTFSFRSLSDSGLTAATRDIIADFDDIDGAAGDRIDLTQIDAISGGVNNAFSYIGSAAFSAAGQLRVYTSGGNTFVAGNVDSNPDADFSIQITGLRTLSAADFWL